MKSVSNFQDPLHLQFRLPNWFTKHWDHVNSQNRYTAERTLDIEVIQRFWKVTGGVSFIITLNDRGNLKHPAFRAYHFLNMSLPS